MNSADRHRNKISSSAPTMNVRYEQRLHLLPVRATACAHRRTMLRRASFRRNYRRDQGARWIRAVRILFHGREKCRPQAKLRRRGDGRRRQMSCWRGLTGMRRGKTRSRLLTLSCSTRRSFVASRRAARGGSRIPRDHPYAKVHRTERCACIVPPEVLGATRSISTASLRSSRILAGDGHYHAHDTSRSHHE